jgi:hypothetical protein
VQDASDIATCETFTGNIVVAADGPETVALETLKTVSGNIDVENVAKLRSFSSSSLQAVSSFTLNNLPELSNLSFPALRNFSSIKWSNLPSLEESTVTSGTLDGEIQEITIVNTSIKSLEWLAWPIGSQLNISSNANLQSFGIPYATINAGSALTFSNNAALTTIGLSNLTGIYGGLQISGNGKMVEASFDKVETIDGFVQMSGDFTNVSMPVLNAINGALRIESTGDITTLCSSLQQKSSLNGHYDCTSDAQKTPTSSNPTGTAFPSSTGPVIATGTTVLDEASGGNKLNTGVKVGLAIAALVFTLAILAAAFFYFRRRSRAKVREISAHPKSPNQDSFTELSDTMSPTNSTHFPKELESPQIALELVGGRERSEMPGVVPAELDAKHGESELTPISPMNAMGRESTWGSVASVRSDRPLIRHELPA